MYSNFEYTIKESNKQDLVLQSRCQYTNAISATISNIAIYTIYQILTGLEFPLSSVVDPILGGSTITSYMIPARNI